MVDLGTFILLPVAFGLLAAVALATNCLIRGISQFVRQPGGLGATRFFGMAFVEAMVPMDARRALSAPRVLPTQNRRLAGLARQVDRAGGAWWRLTHAPVQA